MLSDAKTVYPASAPAFNPFSSRRSVVHSTDGMVACTQPLAARCGLRVLAQGGNAADAAVAVAAGLNLTEPGSTGIGGDMFCLFYDSTTKKISALNGSGRSGMKCSLETIRADLGLSAEAHGSIPMNNVHAVTVPGAAAGWVDTVERFGSGKISLEQILMPAIELGERGFPVHGISATQWAEGEPFLREASPNFAEMLKPCHSAADGYRAPRPGELMRNPTLAATFRSLATAGKKGFYTGRIADSIVKVCKDLGGHLELEDLKNHMDLGSEAVAPISLRLSNHKRGRSSDKSASSDASTTDGEENEGVDIWEHPPNGQGIVALMALGILEELENQGKIRLLHDIDHNSAEHLHAVIEALRIAFADASWWVADPQAFDVPTNRLISKSYLAERAKLFDPEKAAPILNHGSPAHNHCDTVYFAVTDKHGNGISFINSNYEGFGSAIVPKGCGFTLQSRGANFSLQHDHPNVLKPGKRPYHTIIPAMVTNASDGSLHTVYGVMGGFMQPQGHVQVLLNMLRFKMNPQQAIDAPRVCISAASTTGKGGVIFLEDGISEEVRDQLRAMGHKAETVKHYDRAVFGRGQIIRCHKEDGNLVYSGGSDLRGDGAAYPA